LAKHIDLNRYFFLKKESTLLKVEYGWMDGFKVIEMIASGISKITKI